MTMTADTTVGREKPIIFSGESVRAILAGRKSQTRRVVKPQPGMEENGDIHFKWATFYANGLTYTWDSNGVGGENWQANDHPKEDKFTEALKRGPANKFVPYRVGDRLWVRETWAPEAGWDPEWFEETGEKADIVYAADDDSRERCYLAKWYSPIHMRRSASRLTLEVTAVRVERLQEISEADVRAEGIEVVGYGDYPGEFSGKHLFQKAWDAINGKTYPWSSSPWVWVIEFQPVTP